MKGLRMFGAMALAAVLASCASTGRDIPRAGEMLGEASGQNGRACVRVRDIRGYGVLEGNVISIDSTGDYYLATVLPGCVELQTSVRALFSGDFGEICGRTMGTIATRGDRCVINQVFEFEDREQAFDTYHAVLEKRKAL